MVGETKAGHEATRFNTEAERNKNNALKFSICDKVESSIIGDTVHMPYGVVLAHKGGYTIKMLSQVV